MHELIRSLEFWVAVALASIIKLRASPSLNFVGALSTVIVSVLAALVFTPPVLDRFGLSGEIYTAATGALVALTAEHLARQMLMANILEIIKAWRGGK